MAALIEIPTTPRQVHQKIQPDDGALTPSTCPPTPRLATSLAARVASLREAAEKAPQPSTLLVWPGDSKHSEISAGALPFERLWEEILVKFGASGAPALRDAQHFENVIKAGMDANAVPFPHKIGHRIEMPPENASFLCQDDDPFPFLREPAKNWSSDAEKEAVDSLFAGRAEGPEDLRAAFYSREPLDMELVSWPSLQDGVVATDQCTAEQLQVWQMRAERPLSPQRIERRRAALAKKLKGELNPAVFEEVRPEAERETAILEWRARLARDAASDARKFDELAEQGAAFVAWVVPNERRWPEQPDAWKRHAKWFKMWRERPIIASPFAFKPLKRNDSTSSLNSWAMVSDVSWEEMESKASECGWQEVLNDQVPALIDAEPMSQLSKADIVEVKSLCKPPAGVCLTMEVICIMMEVPPVKLKNGGLDYWEPAQKLLGDMCFLERVSALRDHVPASVLDAVTPYMSREDFTPDCIKKQSKACEGLCLWAREVYKYHLLRHASAEAERQQVACRPASELLAKSQGALGHVSKIELQELKCLSKPPREVGEIGSCLVHLFAGVVPEVELTKKGTAKDACWKSAQKLLGSPDKMMQNLKDFKETIDAGRVLRRNVEKVRRILRNMCTEESMRGKSLAAAGIYTWLVNMLAYYDLAAAEQPNPSTNDIAPAAKLQEARGPLSKADLIEIKSLPKPPPAVMLVCMSIVILRPLGKEDENAGWAGAKAMLNDPCLLGAMLKYNPSSITDEQVKKIRELLGEENLLDGEQVKSASKAAYGLLQWVIEMLERFEVAKASYP